MNETATAGVAADIAKTLFANGTLMNLHVGKWGAIKKMKAHDLLLDAAQVDENALYLGHKKLLPKTATEELVRIESEGRAFLYNRSVDFPIAGARFVSYAAMPDLLTRLRDLQVRWNAAVVKLIEEYPAHKAAQLKALEDESDKLAEEELKKVQNETDLRLKRFGELQAWKEAQKVQNESFYPPQNELRRLFYFEWRSFEIQPQTGGMSQVNAEAILEAQQQLQSDLRSWVKEAAVEMHRTLGQAAANARNLLEKHGKLDARNLRPLINAFEAFRAMDFTGKSDFRAVVDRIQKEFITSDLAAASQGLSGDQNADARASLAGLLGEVGKLAVENVAEEAGLNAIAKAGEFARVLDV